MNSEEDNSMDLEGDDDEASKSPKKEQVEVELTMTQRWNRSQEAFQHMLELEENAKKRLALTRRDKKLKEFIKELSMQARTGKQLVDKDQVQTAMELGGPDGAQVAAALGEMADRAMADFSAGSGVVETPEEVDV